MNRLLVPFILIGTALFILLSLARPATGATYASNPSRYFLGADVYPENEVNALRDGTLTRFSNGQQPSNPKKYAEWIIAQGHLTGSENLQGIRYYVIPRLHPGLELFVPALCLLCAGLLSLAFLSKKKSAAQNGAVPSRASG